MKPYYQDELVTIYNGDCRDVMSSISGANCVLTDPPYMFGMASTMHEGKAGGWGDMMNSSSFYACLLRKFQKIVENRSGSAWVFNSWRSFPILARAAFDAEWPIESLMIWDKEWIGPGGMRGLRPSYEVCALFCCKEFQFLNRGQPDIVRSKWHPGNRQSDHPAEKPVALLMRIIENSTKTGELVMDPFCGSGSTLVAAKQAGRKSVGIEIEEKWCEVAAKRLQQEMLSLA